jgi:uncharacterized protein YndB with AHSA1/START domain
MISSDSTTVTKQGDREILITRAFDAPAALVFKAWTTPELVRRWWTAKRGTMTVCEIDLREGGKWRYAMTADSDGQHVEFYGEYREIVPNERLVSTEIYAPFPDQPALNTLTFEERDGRTRATLLVSHDTPQARDMHLESGMENGLRDALDLLEEVAQSLA